MPSPSRQNHVTCLFYQMLLLCNLASEKLEVTKDVHLLCTPMGVGSSHPTTCSPNRFTHTRGVAISENWGLGCV